MEIKVTRRTSNDGVYYSISNLTFEQIFRIKHAMFDAEEKMKGISKEWFEKGQLAYARDFKNYAKDAHDVFVAVSEHI
jgi:antitoxin component YwqK of YwqJK toxin-antitoxin module